MCSNETKTEKAGEKMVCKDVYKRQLYDTFSKKYGLINSRANVSAFSQDSSFALLSALEVLDENGELERKADMFTKRRLNRILLLPRWIPPAKHLPYLWAKRLRWIWNICVLLSLIHI